MTGAEDTLAERLWLLRDSFEHRLEFSRGVRDEAQDLGCRCLPLPGFLKFEGKLFDFRFRAGGAGDAHCFWRVAALSRYRRAASRFILSAACSRASSHCLPRASG